ncbi:DNA cytosine methyltransferase [Sulfuricaulis sp.]|uniref:DNA cytosine methyltransferase n=1 Tax=Sulfuricaulis sp. TaxID=2003553 RepID=UPI0034A4570C
MAKPTALDLFCGAGGLTEGLRQAGYKVLGAVELDPLASRAYRLNHKRVRLWETDVRRLTGPAILQALGLKRGDLDLLAACPPCQGFSAMRTNNGTRWNRDARNDLIFDVLRLIRTLRPVSVMLENVPRLSKNRRFKKFRTKLESLGYQVQWDILNTVNFGVPQRRRRLVLLASRETLPGFAPNDRNRRTVRQFIEKLSPPSRSRDILHNYKVERSKKVRKIIRQIPRNGGSRSALGSKNQLKCHQGFDGFRDVYGRMAWDKPSSTITGGCINPSKGRFLHPQADRAITLREAALLQTFPKSYRFPLNGNRYAVALLIGNALPPEFIRRHAVALRESIREST